jgi:hypothetical protein
MKQLVIAERICLTAHVMSTLIWISRITDCFTQSRDYYQPAPIRTDFISMSMATGG